MNYPRIMLAAPKSGSGKTMVTCGILQALTRRGLKAASFKCGPDYIDSLYHEQVIGTLRGNLDTYFTDEGVTRWLFAQTACKVDISIIEGVMGYYDGVAGISTEASSYELASVINCPVILIVDCKAMSVSVVALIQGFLAFGKEKLIQGIILNRLSKARYVEMKNLIEGALPVIVLGYVPEVEELMISSRHLGLLTPGEIPGLRETLDRLAGLLEETIDIERFLELGEKAIEIAPVPPEIPCVSGGHKPVIAVAKDKAFCFYYRENLKLLERMGAELFYFSPLKDKKLPQGINGMLIGGGYPELYGKELSENREMLKLVKEGISSGLPIMAECGGFMYLHETMEDMEGRQWPMCGVIQGKSYYKGKLMHFGYQQIESKTGELIRAHEFHYFDSTNYGEDYLITKPLRNTMWRGIHGKENSIMGFSHLYYYSNPNIPLHFLEECSKFEIERSNENAAHRTFK